jgi:hypothetical protein
MGTVTKLVHVIDQMTLSGDDRLPLGQWILLLSDFCRNYLDIRVAATSAFLDTFCSLLSF